MSVPRKKHVYVEMIGDFSSPCSWCGKRQLEKVVLSNECQEQYTIQVRHLPFVCNPSLPEAEELQTMTPPNLPPPFPPQVLRSALRVGLGNTVFRANNLARSASTLQSHCLLKFCEQTEPNLKIQSLLADLLYSSFLGNGNYPTMTNIVEHARAVGLDATQARLFLESREEEGLVRSEVDQYAKLGVQQLPFFILNGKAMFAGCQEHAVIMRALEECPYSTDY